MPTQWNSDIEALRTKRQIWATANIHGDKISATRLCRIMTWVDFYVRHSRCAAIRQAGARGLVV